MGCQPVGKNMTALPHLENLAPKVKVVNKVSNQLILRNLLRSCGHIENPTCILNLKSIQKAIFIRNILQAKNRGFGVLGSNT